MNTIMRISDVSQAHFPIQLSIMMCYLPGVCDEPGNKKLLFGSPFSPRFFVSLFVQNSSKIGTKAARYYQKLNASQKNFLGVDKKVS